MITRGKRTALFVLALSCILSLGVIPAQAKTVSSAKAENIFFYAVGAEGKSVLLKVMPLDDLKAVAHGQPNGGNYYISTTDNYPTTQYCEARGFTISELIDYVKSASPVSGASSIDFSGGDTLRFMATDSYGNYSRSWTCEELYGAERYYFEKLYDAELGWNIGWEVGGEQISMYGVTLDEYNENYKASDLYYEKKRAVFESGVEMPVILATESYSGRTTTDSLTASTEPGVASYIAANGNTVAGSLRNAVTDEYALRLCIPMTEADLMSAHRTSYDNFKWIYNLQLDMEDAPDIRSLGTVAEPVVQFSVSGSTLTITMSCDTAGASIYYGWDGSTQTRYTGPITVDISGKNLESTPVTVYAAAVKEGCDDAGVLTFKYPGMAPNFQTVYSGMTGSALTFAAADSVSASAWTAWTGALSFITVKTPAVAGYVQVDPSQYTVDDIGKTVTFDRSLFTDVGSYSFIFHAAKYADKSVSVTMKKAAPELRAPETAALGAPVTLTFEEDGYNSGLSVYVTPEGGERTMISASYLDRTQAGRVTIQEDYFTLPSTAMGTPGRYTLELVNNSYTPASQTVTVTVGFTDVAPDAWYYTCVTGLANAGIINGVGGGLFAPEGTLSWGEAMKLLMLACGYEAQKPTSAHWASGYMDQAAADGLAAAGTDPDAVISRLEFCRTAAKALNAETTLAASPFPDTDDPAVLALYEMGIINGIDDGSFAPGGTLTRSQISKIIWCILEQEGMK